MANLDRRSPTYSKSHISSSASATTTTAATSGPSSSGDSSSQRAIECVGVSTTAGAAAVAAARSRLCASSSFAAATPTLAAACSLVSSASTTTTTTSSNVTTPPPPLPPLPIGAHSEMIRLRAAAAAVAAASAAATGDHAYECPLTTSRSQPTTIGGDSGIDADTLSISSGITEYLQAMSARSALVGDASRASSLAASAALPPSDYEIAPPLRPTASLVKITMPPPKVRLPI